MSSMNEYFSDYLHSLKLDKAVFFTFAVDAVYVLLMIALFSQVTNKLTRTLVVLTGGRSTEQFKQYFYSLAPSQLVAFKDQAQSLVFLLVLLLIVLPLLAFILYGLSNSIVWHLLQKKEFIFRKHWKWSLAHFVLIVIALVLLFLSLVVRKSLLYLAPSLGQTASNILFFVLIMFFFTISFLLSYHFLHTHKVGQSITLAFDTLRQKFRHSVIITIFAAITIVALRLILIYPLSTRFFIHPSLGLYVGAAVFLLWLAWFRAYFIKNVFGQLPKKATVTPPSSQEAE